MKHILIAILLLTQGAYAKKHKKRKQGPISFFRDSIKQQDTEYEFNAYENLISGIAAFTVGNIGFFTTDNSALKLAYTGIQTIGIINIGQGIYKSNSPQFQKAFYRILLKDKKRAINKSILSREVIRIFAEDERAKRLSIFYSSTFLATQYIINSTLDDPEDKIKNIYIFLGAVNIIAAVYYGFSKSEYERFYYGSGVDLNPFAFRDTRKNTYYGLALNYSF